MSEIYLADPGKKWRRLVRWGAGLCVFAILIPYERNQTLLLSDLHEVIMVALGGRFYAIPTSPQDILFIGFCCLLLPAIFGGAVYLGACGSALLRPGHRRSPLAILLMLWVSTTLTPYYFTFRNLPPRSPETETLIAMIVAALSVYLFISGLSFLTSWRMRGTPLFVFGFGLLPLICTAAAWIGIASAVVMDRSVRLGVAFVVGSGVLGSILMLIGWLKWWGAVKRELAKCKNP